ncbi:MAG: ROK family protein [Bacteroidota bacterium]
MAEILGIDVGGTGIKAAMVDTINGEFTKEKIKRGTPQPSTPENVAIVLNELIDEFGARGTKIGCGFPSIIKHGVCYSAANIDKSWLGVNLVEYFQEVTGCEGYFVNDADAAGYAEMTYGRGVGRMGTVILITLGTGIGSGLFLDGKLVPNSEFGHLLYKDSIFEHYASNGARKRLDLNFEEWGAELNTYLNHLNTLLSPELIIIGGGVSKKFEKYQDYLNVDTEIIPAEMMNDAGIIGAAVMANL